MSDQFDILGQQAQAAESYGVRQNYGKLEVNITRYIQWKDGYPLEVTPQVFGTLKEGKALEVEFFVNIQEFNPELEFEYRRRVTIPGADWRTIVRPSLVELFGEDVVKDYASAFRKLHGAYVEIHDVPQAKQSGDKAYNTIKFVKVFANRTECFNAYNERYGKDSAATPTESPAEVPPAYDAESWSQTIPMIKEALANGSSPVKVSEDFGIPMKFVMQAKNA